MALHFVMIISDILTETEMGFWIKNAALSTFFRPVVFIQSIIIMKLSRRVYTEYTT